jgi:hypothetical protein
MVHLNYLLNMNNPNLISNTITDIARNEKNELTGTHFSTSEIYLMERILIKASSRKAFCSLK